MKIRVNEISFGRRVLYNHTYRIYSTWCYDKCLKNREHEKLFLDTVDGATY